MVIAIGVVLSAAGLVLLFNVGGAGDMVIKRVTSQSLGDLAPGFASTKRGFNIYATLILAVGVFALGLGVAGWYVPIGTSLMGFGGTTFGGGVEQPPHSGHGEVAATPQTGSPRRAGMHRRRVDCCSRRAPPECRRLQQRVAGEAIRAMHPGARALARRKEALDRRAAVEVGRDASHRVVPGRSDGHRLP